MVLGERLVKKKDGYTTIELSFINIFGILKFTKESLLSDINMKLTEEDIEKIQNLYKKGKIKFKTIKIAKTVPFAPFMFLGVLLTYILQGNIFSYLIVLKAYFEVFIKIIIYKIFHIRLT